MRAWVVITLLAGAKKMGKRLTYPLMVFTFGVWLVIGSMDAAEAELFFSGYLGTAATLDSDVSLQRPGNTQLTFGDVSWDDDSFSGPIYYGYRIGYWFKNTPNLGVAIDFTHAKMYAEIDKTVHVSGTRNGAPVSGTERLWDTFDGLSFSHGHNVLTANGMYRWMDLGRSDQVFLSRLQPYVLAGIGLAIPHVEVSIAGDSTDAYQTAGWAAQAGGGLDLDINRWFAVFAEYRLGYAEITADLQGGGSLETEPWTHHLTLGVTFSFMH